MQDLAGKIEQYQNEDIYPFHMPGHKRTEAAQPAGTGRYDYTEIDGFDNLYRAQGIIAKSQRRAAQLFGAGRTFYLVNGSTAGILAAILSLKGDKSENGPKKILIGPDCHKSVYNGARLAGLTAVTLGSREPLTDLVNIENEFDWNTLPKRIETALKRETKSSTEIGAGAEGSFAAVVITSPTYEGVVSDVARIARAAHEAGAILIVDEAHGTHLGMHPYFPQNSCRLGADIVIHSMHKTMTGLTQTALLHVNGPREDDGRAQAGSKEHEGRAQADPEHILRALEMIQTSSPSYLLMYSVDACVKMLTEKKDELFGAYVQRLEEFRRRSADLQNIRLFETEHYDKGKIVIAPAGDGPAGSTSGAPKPVTAPEIYAALRDRFGIQLEFAQDGYALAMTSFADTDEGYERLYAALKQIDDEITAGRQIAAGRPAGDEAARAGQTVRKSDCYENAAN